QYARVLSPGSLSDFTCLDHALLLIGDGKTSLIPERDQLAVPTRRGNKNGDGRPSSPRLCGTRNGQARELPTTTVAWPHKRLGHITGADWRNGDSCRGGADRSAQGKTFRLPRRCAARRGNRRRLLAPQDFDSELLLRAEQAFAEYPLCTRPVAHRPP